MVAAAAVVALGAVAMVRVPTLPVILGAQAAIGAASAIFGPAIAFRPPHPASSETLAARASEGQARGAVRSPSPIVARPKVNA